MVAGNSKDNFFNIHLDIMITCDLKQDRGNENSNRSLISIKTVLKLIDWNDRVLKIRWFLIVTKSYLDWKLLKFGMKYSYKQILLWNSFVSRSNYLYLQIFFLDFGLKLVV